MAFCRYCGAQLRDGAKFCGSCGNSVNEKSDLALQAKTSVLQASQVAIHTNKKRPIIIICLVLGFLIIAGVVLLLVLGGKSKDSNDSTEIDYNDTAKRIYTEISTYCTKQETNGSVVTDGVYFSEDGGDFITTINKKLDDKVKWCAMIINNSPYQVFVCKSYCNSFDSEDNNARSVFVSASTICTKMETAGNPLGTDIYGTWQLKQTEQDESSNETDQFFKKTLSEERQEEHQEFIKKVKSSISKDFNFGVYIISGEPLFAVEYTGVYPKS